MRRSMRTWTLLTTTLATVSACGGSQVVDEAPAAAPVVERAPQPVEQVDARLWYVYWDGIHVLTVYPRAGVVRSEEPQNQFPPFGGSNAHFSIISHYYEQEDLFGPVISEATSLDDLLRRLVEVELVEIEQTVNPVYEL